MGFANNTPVHYFRQRTKWGQNFLARYDVPKGGKRATWRLVAPDGSELRLKLSRWDHDLREGWYDEHGQPFTAAETRLFREKILGALAAREATRVSHTDGDAARAIKELTAENIRLCQRNEAQETTIRTLMDQNDSLKAENERLCAELAKYKPVPRERHVVLSDEGAVAAMF